MTKYEKEITRKILKTIEKYQEYLTQPENLPQLAKLGFLFSYLYRAGRVAYGYTGYIEKGDVCENNPKDELESIDYKDEDSESLIYDAWGMHDIDETKNYEEFVQYIKEGRQLSAFDKMLMAPNKTMEDWLIVRLDERYKYFDPSADKFQVYNYLLCVIGNGYGLNKNGFVYLEASGADQDQDDYGDWENAKFEPKIQKVVDKILINPLVKPAVNCFHKLVCDEQTKKLNEERKAFNGLTYKEYLGSDAHKAVEERLGMTKTFQNWYPISDYSIMYEVFNGKKASQSVVNACIEIAEDILRQEKANPKKDRHFADNLKFAKKFLKKFEHEKV